MGDSQEEHDKQGHVCYANLISYFSIDESFQKYSNSLPGTMRETNGDFPYKCKCLINK